MLYFYAFLAVCVVVLAKSLLTCRLSSHLPHSFNTAVVSKPMDPTLLSGIYDKYVDEPEIAESIIKQSKETISIQAKCSHCGLVVEMYSAESEKLINC